jgi:hypothetical protein
MGVVRTAFVPEDRASSAKVIGGSLKFNDDDAQYLARTPGSSGNQKTWTYSCWFKLGHNFGGHRGAFLKAGATSADYFKINIASDDKLYVMENISSAYKEYFSSSNYFRDPNAWMHLVLRVDTTNGTDAEKVRVYLNGTEQAGTRTVNPGSSHDTFVGGTTQHEIGASTVNTQYFDGHITDVQFVDGSSLGPGSFGFTDPLTNTWRPKDYTGSYGTTGYHLPLDGSAPIGSDKSGNGLNFKAISFGRTASIDKATGALPILQTVSGGRAATSGIRTDAFAPGQLVLAMPMVGITSDVSPLLNGGTTGTPITVTAAVPSNSNAEVASNFYNGSFFYDGSGDSLWVESDAQMDFGTADFTIEGWFCPTDLTHERHLPLIQNGNSAANNYYDWRLYFNNHGHGSSVVWFDAECSGDNPDVESTSAVVTNKWHHIAITRESGTFKLFFNGVLEDTDASSSNAIDTDRGTNIEMGYGNIGSAGATFYKGYLQDWRVYKGVAKYKGDFIPASPNPDILPDTPSGVDYGSKLEKTTMGSVSAPTYSDYLSLADHADFTLGTNNFTFECFVYSGSSGRKLLFHQTDSSGTDASTSILCEIPAASPQTFKVMLRCSSNSTTYTVTGTETISPHKWYHLAVVRNGSNLILYVDGNNDGTAAVASETVNDSSETFKILSGYSWGGSPAFMRDFRFVNGSAVYTANFTPPTGPLTSITNTKLLCCQSKTSTTAYTTAPGTITASGNVVTSDFNPFEGGIEYARGKSAGYATLDPLFVNNGATYKHGNLVAQMTGPGFVCSSIPMKTGKWYCEIINTAHGSTHMGIGISKVDGIDGQRQPDESQNTKGWALWHISGDGSYRKMGIGASWDSTTAWNDWGQTWGSADAYDVMGLALDMDKRTITYYKNGTNMGTTENGLTPVVDWGSWIDADSNTVGTGFVFVAGNGQSGATADFEVNFGQKPWKYRPPEGFQSANLANLDRPTVVRPDTYFKAVTYTGTGAIKRMTDMNFQSDMIWIKDRSAANDHVLQDSVRGSYILYPNTNGQEGATGGGWIRKMVQNGFEVDVNGPINTSSNNYIAWCWKAGGKKNTFNVDDIGYATAAAAGLDGGTIDPTAASVGTQPGLSILGYTGTGSAGTIAHGLGKKPAFIITRNRVNTAGSLDWPCYHHSKGATGYIRLNITNAWGAKTAIWNDVEPTSSLITIGSDSDVNVNTETYIMYAWTEVPGFSKFGQYTGDDNDPNGPFVYLGFRPAFIIIKCDSNAEAWGMYDSSRDTYNVADKRIKCDANTEEQSGDADRKIDFLSNGFKIKGDDGELNTDNYTYLYMAWAESPLNNLYGGQSNAR